MLNTKRILQNWLFTLCVVNFWLCIGCSIPNLEPQTCIDARTAVREFYSFHFGNDMHFSQDNLKLRARFLTAEFASRLSTVSDGADPFTTGDTDFPKAFRVGKCTETAPNMTVFQVLLFWRDDVRSEQREIKADLKLSNGKWLIDGVTR